MQGKSSKKTQKSASTSDFVSKWKKDKSTKSTSASLQQNKNKPAEKGLASQQNVAGMEFSVLVENLSPTTEDRSLLIHFRRFDPDASCKILKPDPQDVTAVASFSSKEKMENVLALTHAVDCRLLKLTRKKQQPPSKRPLETTGKNEQPSKKMCLASPQGHIVYVEGLGTNTSQETVAEYFKRFGKVVEATVTIAGKGESKKKIAFISLAKENSAKAAINKKKHTIDGVGVTVRLAEGSEERGNVNGARSSLADSKDESDGEESGEDEDESDEDEEESGEEEEESSDDDVQVQPQPRIKIPVTAEDSDDEEDDNDDSDDDEDDEEEDDSDE